MPEDVACMPEKHVDGDLRLSKTDDEDLIMREHPEPRNHVRMPRLRRAAQFMPFAALKGSGEWGIQSAPDNA